MFALALRYGFARCSHALCAFVLPTFSKVGARRAGEYGISFSIAFSLCLLGQRKSG